MEDQDAEQLDPILVAIDASEMLQVKFGRGRYLKAFLNDLAKDPRFTIRLIADDDLHDTLEKRFVNTPIKIVKPADIRRRACDVVWYPWGTVPFACDAPSIVTLHDLGPYTKAPDGWLAAQRARHTMRRMIRNVDGIVALSQWSAKKISETLDVAPDAIIVAPPLPDSSWSPGFQELKHPDLGAMPFILVVAGWKKHHEIELVLRAHASAFRHEEIQLVVCGPLSDEAQVLLRKLPHQLHITNQLDDGELRGLYRNAAIVVHPATKSHWSQVAAEALCCGAALIAADSASNTEIVGPAGYLLDPDIDAQWSATLAQVFADTELQADMKATAKSQWASASRSTSFTELANLLEEFGS